MTSLINYHNNATIPHRRIYNTGFAFQTFTRQTDCYTDCYRKTAMYSPTQFYKYIIILLFWLLTACSGVPPKTAADHNTIGPANAGKHAAGWRAVRFQIAWQPDNEPDWYIDTMIAGEVLAPIVLTQAGKKLKLWRVHRRAKNDAAGHTFSFIFYTQNDDAERIYASIGNNDLVKQWQRQGMIKWLQFDDLQHNTRPNIEDTSDRNWPRTLQKTWPAYIMGASQMWLELVAELKTAHKDTTSLELCYQAIQQEITRLWETHGQHTWLHHLSALYGYSPIAIHF